MTMDRPRYRNAQSRRLLEEMDAAFAQAVSDDDVRVIILAGEGEHFSSGHDIGTEEELADREERPYPKGFRGSYQRSWDLFLDSSLRWRNVSKPTIAQVHGYCIYGGWIIASAMDLIVASEDARFLPSHFQYFSVPWDLGPRKTKEILWEARFVDAKEAMELGLVSRVAPRADLPGATNDLAATIAKMDPFAARMVKLSVNQMQDAMGFSTSIRAAHSNYMLLEGRGDAGVPRDDRAVPVCPGSNERSEARRSARMSETPDALPLTGTRVIDVSEGVAGGYCTRLLAGLGADVIKVEPSGRGDSLRALGPFPHDVRDSELSALHLYLNAGKRSVELDLESAIGRDQLLGLAATGDLFVDSLSEAEASSLGLTLDELRRRNATLDVVSISPWGRIGALQRPSWQ